jgi:hypothetical protein
MARKGNATKECGVSCLLLFSGKLPPGTAYDDYPAEMVMLPNDRYFFPYLTCVWHYM